MSRKCAACGNDVEHVDFEVVYFSYEPVCSSSCACLFMINQFDGVTREDFSKYIQYYEDGELTEIDQPLSLELFEIYENGRRLINLFEIPLTKDEIIKLRVQRLKDSAVLDLVIDQKLRDV